MNRSVSDNNRRRPDSDNTRRKSDSDNSRRKSEPSLQPMSSEQPQATPSEPAAPAQPEPRTYTVVPGDTLSQIGERFGIDYLRIVEANQIPNPDLIHPGQVLIIPQ